MASNCKYTKIFVFCKFPNKKKLKRYSAHIARLGPWHSSRASPDQTEEMPLTPESQLVELGMMRVPMVSVPLP